MTELLTLTEEQRRNVFNQVGFLAGLSPKVVEKDWWVTLTLKAIFQTQYAPHILFKGGTSLSKCWNLISRFSEDIDLAIDREYLGFGGDLSVKKIHNLKKAACEFTTNVLKTALEEQILALGVPEGMVTITAKPVLPTFPDMDPQELRLAYPSLYEPIEYIADLVKIEVSGRSLKEPWATCTIQSFVTEYLPGQDYSGEPFEVFAVEPKRTFLEKLFLLHEEFLKLDDIRHLRMSRHLYDVVKLMDTIHGWNAILDLELYEFVIAHRTKYHKLPGINYKTHAVATINFIPPESIRKEYQSDYQVMRERMIHEENAPSFEQLITQLQELLNRIQSPIDFGGRTLQEIIEDAQQNDPKDSSSPNFMIEGSAITIPVTYITDPVKPVSQKNENARYEVIFLRKNKELVFRKIKKNNLDK